MFGRKRIRELEAEVTRMGDIICKMVERINILESPNYSQVIHQYVRDTLDAGKTSLQSEIHTLVANTARTYPCSHGLENSTVICAVTYSKNMPPCEFGELFAVNSNGKITFQSTCFALTTEGNYQVYARRCNICGQLSPVTWFDITAAGSAVEQRSVHDLKSYEPILPDSPARSKLDAALNA